MKSGKCGQLNPKALAVSLGALWGAYLLVLGLVLTFWSNAQFVWISPELLNFLATIYPGYAATLVGSLIGLLWGIVDGAICGALIAWVHNLALRKYC